MMFRGSKASVDPPGTRTSSSKARSIDPAPHPVIACEVRIDPPLGNGLLHGGEAGVILVVERQAVPVEIDGSKTVGLVNKQPVKTLEEVVVGPEAALDEESFEAVPLV